MSSSYKQYLRTKLEVESSLLNARILRDKWVAASGENPTNLTKREVDDIGKAFKHRLLAVKWDCEDLEDLVNSSGNDSSFKVGEIENARILIQECRNEISLLINELEEAESNSKLFNKHGLMPLASNQAVTPMIQSSGSRYEKLTSNDAEEIQFDKNQVASSATIFNNSLYDHLEQNEEEKSFNSPQVFNNISKPITNVYMNPNENEIILDMLETEYYNPPSGLQTESRFNYTIRKLLERDRNRFLGAVAFLLSFPILMVFFLIA